MGRRKHKKEKDRRKKEKHEAIDLNESLHQQEKNEVSVYPKLRPINKLETKKRSKDCIELHEDPRKVTVDAPLHGIRDFFFKGVFDEYATQREVYEESCLPEIPPMLLEGIDCAVLVYGQANTGKTHFIFGQQSLSTEGSPEVASEFVGESAGALSRIATDLFQKIHNDLPSSTECIVRFSMAELYLEQWRDLLAPSSRSGDGLSESIWVDQQSNLNGISQLCCLRSEDIIRAMVRGNSFRTQSATVQNRHAARSHVIMQVKVETIDRNRNVVVNSMLRVIDLAGSEPDKAAMSQGADDAVALESKLTSASIQTLNNYLKVKVMEQNKAEQGEKRNPPSTVFANVSKLTKYLQPIFAEAYCTKVILTASPASLNIQETMNTLQFGTSVRQLLLPRLSLARNRAIPFDEYPSRLRKAEAKAANLTNFVRLLAVECRTVRKTGK